MQLKELRKTYQKSKSLLAQLQQEKRLDTYVKKERTRLESELEMDRYVKRELERVWVSLKLLLYLIASPLLIPLIVLPLLMVGFVMLVMSVKDLVVGLTRLCWAPFLSGTKETPGTIEKIGEWPNEQLFKKYRGSASLDSKHDRGENKNVEGNHKVILYKGKIKRILHDITDGIRSSCSYVGASDLEEFRSLVEFDRSYKSRTS